jgi:hypothetical protein
LKRNIVSSINILLAECSYDGSATQVDLFNLVKLNETVDILQKRVQSIETDIKDVCSNTQYVANEVRMTREGGGNKFIDKSNKEEEEEQEQDEHQETPKETITQTVTKSNLNSTSIPRNSMNNLLATSNAQWSLSLTPKGLRIDTNIISLHDLYDILLSGVSQFDLSSTSSSSSSCVHEIDSSSSQSSMAESPRPENATVLRKKPLWKTRLKTFPLYSSWEPENNKRNLQSHVPNDSNNDSPSTAIELLSEETLQHMVKIFCECFLCLPCPDPANSIALRYKSGTLDPLLANSVFAWTARHAAIYHNLFPGKDPNQVGEPFFLKAKSLIKDRFMKTSVDTMHSLLIMYIYAIGIPSEHKAEVESEAYIYLGLAIRMCLDLKMNLESKSPDPYEREEHRRFFWVLYFLETLGSIHSDKPFSLPPKNMITVNFPTVMEHEQTGESRYRVEFMIQRFKITRIYRNIIYKTTGEKPLLSQISAIDKELENWRAALPSYLKYEAGDIHKRNWNSTSFREQACIKLNFEYNFQLCQLYGLFFSKSSNEEDQPSAIEVLSRDICLKAARNTVELLECWIQLKQLWCHFSLENLMMTTMIYSNILSQPNDDEREIAKKNLEKIAKILMSSPVRHHKYVLTIVSKIKSIFRESLGTNLMIDVDSISPKQQSQQPVIPKTVANLSESPPSPPPPTPLQLQLPHAQHPTSDPNIHHTPSNTVSTNEMQPISLTNPFSQKNPIFNVIDVASASSAFDIHKTDTFSEDMHFSDFVYTPTILDYGTAVNPTGILANVMTRGGYSQGKKPDYTTTGEDPYMQHRPYTSSPQYSNYGYNSNSTATADTHTNHTSSPQQSNIPFQPPTNSSSSSPSWLQMEPSAAASSSTPSTQPVLLNHPTKEAHHSYIRMTSTTYNDRQNHTPPPPQQPPSSSQQQQQQQTSAHHAMKNYYNNPGPYY